METLECIKNRRSIRKFLNKPVEWDKVGKILDAGRLAPNSGNLQDWYFIVVDDKDKIKKLAQASLQQYWMADAPIHIVVCSITQHAKQFYGLRGERLYSIQNCAAAVENMLLAATDLGLGSCWVGAFDENKVCEILKIPERARPQAIVVIGYAAEQPPEPAKKTLENITFLNRYGENAGRIKDLNYTLGDTSAVFREMAKKGKSFLERINEKLMKKNKR